MDFDVRDLILQSFVTHSYRSLGSGNVKKMRNRGALDWVPGVLNNVQLTNLCEKGLITGKSLAALKETIGLSSIDLSLSDEGYELVDGAVKPVGPDYTIDRAKKARTAGRLSIKRG